jgi:hypothetical protein
MVSSGLLRRVALVITDVSEEPGASFIRVTKIGQLGTTKLQLATDVRCEEMVLIRATRRNNPEDTILHSHRRENLKSYISGTVNILLSHLKVLSWHEFVGPEKIKTISDWRAGNQTR